MAKRKRVVGVLAAVMLLGVLSGRASAIPGFPDPTDAAKIALLMKIADRLHDAYKILANINARTKALRDRVEEMFPNNSLDEIRSVFANVRSIQDEITSMSCGWRFSPRTEALRLGLLKLGPLCKDQYQRAFGQPNPGLDQDLAEYRQWQGAIRMNVVKETIAGSEKWKEAADELGRLTRRAGSTQDPDNPSSVGYSMRLLAVGEAQQLQLAARQNSTEAMRLSGIQEDLDAERREDWLRENAAAFSLSQIARFKDLPSPSSVRR